MSLDFSGRRALIFAGNNYEDLELWYPLLRLREAGFRVEVGGTEAGPFLGKNGYPCEPNCVVGGFSGRDFDVVVCPGGWMPDRLRRHPDVQRILREADAAGRVIAAICHGGWMPISAGIMKGVRVTGSPGIKDDLVNAGALFEDAPVVVDRHHVSSRKPDDLPDFMKGIFAALAAKVSS